jgi:hypothetical protein
LEPGLRAKLSYGPERSSHALLVLRLRAVVTGEWVLARTHGGHWHALPLPGCLRCAVALLQGG